MEQIFTALWQPSRKQDSEALWLICRPPGEILLSENGDFCSPDQTELSDGMLIGQLDGRPVLLKTRLPADTAPANAEWVSIRTMIARRNPAVTQMLSRASMLTSWDVTHRYCGCCGSATEISRTETARICLSCGFQSFPRISPAVIVRITDEDRILLAHNSRFPNGLYSCVAGFTDAGETPEQTVIREIREEISLEAATPRYLRSQPWPFPHSLMLGYETTAQGCPVPDGEEITDARWFSAADMPRIPDHGTIARWMIDDWLASLRDGSQSG